MRIDPYEHIYTDNTLNSLSTPQAPSSNANSGNNLLKGILSSPKSLDLLKNVIPFFANRQGANSQNNSPISGLTQLFNANTQNVDNSQYINDANKNQQVQPLQTSIDKAEPTFPSINPQYALENLLHPQKNVPTPQVDKSLDHSKQHLIKQMQLHKQMMEKINRY